jgi:hypothetical protein
MADKETKEKPQVYLETGNLEAHIIADMLRIENITTELRDFKQGTEKRLDKLEGWIVGIVGITVTTLLSVLVAILVHFLGN